MVDQTGFLAVAGDAVEHLKRLMEQYPHLVSPHVKNAVNSWSDAQHAGGDIEIVACDLKAAQEESLVDLAIELIEKHQVEDVMHMLAEKFSLEVDYNRLIELVGDDRYIQALKREVVELEINSVSNEQMANLWNSLGKPALGKDRWTTEAVSALAE